ncbi:hypothetical protein JD844_005779 [Phrynosoma platyrhinos]|uniref:UPAR/Ly6 domain-containing protein n=1 Tax=Phrynosoma platyrhinos TaxID=52577 RepID=A0ABQ7TNS9_PHRPL|nr:hypothetical protein JD844_005779 [Phrynosoma platyrhinos]
MILTVPSHTNFVPNGLHCPACFSLFSDNCTSQDNVSCMDLETNCFSMGSIVQSVGSNSAYAAKACIESEFCVPGFYSASALNGVHFSSNLECCHSDLCNSNELSSPLVEHLLDTVFTMAVRGCGTEDICAYKPGILEMDSDLVLINITHAECQIARTNVPEATIPNDYP